MALTLTDTSKLYVTIFNRVSERGGSDFWRNAIPNDNRLVQMADTANEMLKTGTAITYFGTALDGGPDNNYDFVEQIYLNTLNQTPADDPGGIQFWADALNAGATHGEIVASIIDVIENTPPSDPAYPNFLLYENRAAASDYAYTIMNSVPAESDIEVAVSFSLVDDGNGLYVTADEATLPAARVAIDTASYMPFNEKLTNNRDFIWSNRGDDVVSAFVLDGAESPIQVGDVYNGAEGFDTLEIKTDITDLVLSEILEGTITLESVEKLKIIALGDIETIDTSNVDFDEIELDVGGSDTPLAVNGVDPSIAYSYSNFSTTGELQRVTFSDDNINEVVKTEIKLGQISTTSGPLNFRSSVEYGAATSVYAIVDLKDILHTLGAGSFQHQIDLADSPINATVNAIFNVENVIVSDSASLNTFLYINQAGGASNYVTVNLTNTNNVAIDMVLEGFSTPTSENDVTTLNLDNVRNTGNKAEFNVDHAETVNVNVLSDSELETINSGVKANIGVDLVVNLSADAALSVNTWNLRDTNGDTFFNIAGAGDVNLNLVGGGSGAGDVVISGATATGDLMLTNLPAKVISVKTGSGMDTISLQGGEIDIQTNAAADMIDVTNGSGTVIYALRTDSQLALTESEMTGFDVISGFETGGDIIELASSLSLFGGIGRDEVLQKGSIGGTTAADMNSFIGNGTDFFFDANSGYPVNINRVTAFAEDGEDGYLFIDVDNNGDFSEAGDIVIQLAGVTTFTIDDIQFG
ncbi:MAG: DUF4214 domain-containing protein [Methyloprofundus sp.]|nr:DUF4214 domain-containing protein [Methyloprofundus sp.]